MKATHVGWAGLAGAAVLALAGCSSPSAEVAQYAKQAAAAEQSAAYGSGLFHEGKALQPETSTLLDDAMKELNSANQSLSQVQARGGEATMQHRALSAVRRATDALLAAQRELDRGAISASAVSGLRHAAAVLRKAERP
jgi:hypothetical protein